VNLEPLVGAILGVSLLQRSVGKNGTRRRCADYRRSRLFQLQACEKRFFLSQCAYQSSWVDQRLHDRHCDFQPRVQALWADASGVELLKEPASPNCDDQKFHQPARRQGRHKHAMQLHERRIGEY